MSPTALEDPVNAMNGIAATNNGTEANSTRLQMKPLKGYDVPLTTLNDPENRAIKIITIGASLSGIIIAYKVNQQL